MINQVCNCIVCAQEFNIDELRSIALSKINITRFKICQACLDISEPENDYLQVRNIILSYLKSSEAKLAFSEVQDILGSITKL